MKELKSWGKVESGKFVPIDVLFDTFRHFEGLNVVVSVKKYSEPKSRKLHNYYFGGVVKPIALETGYSIEETHLELKKMFAREDMETPYEPFCRLKSFSDYAGDFDTAVTMQYVDEIRNWASNFLNLYIESPEEWKMRKGM